MIKVLVTGAAGQLGQAFAGLASQALEKSVDLILLDRHQLDITSAQSIHSALAEHQPDAVVNGAAYTAVDKAEQETDAAFLLNAKAPELLAKDCKEQGIWLLQVSTDYVFDGVKTGAYVETDPVSPAGVYGQSKLEGEQAVLAASADNLVLRTSWVFSEYGNNFLKTMLRLAAERDQLGIVHDQRGGPTYAPHIALTLLQLIDLKLNQNKSVAGGVYHFSGQPAVSWYEFALEIFNQAYQAGMLTKIPDVKPITTAEFPTLAKRPVNSEISNIKINDLGIVIKNSWKEGVALAIRKI